MAIKFTYGTTYCEFGRDPQKPDYGNTRMWMSPRLESAGAEYFTYDKSLVKDIRTLTWKRMRPTDLANLLTFLDVVDGAAHGFCFRDVDMANYYAHIWNSDELRSYPTQYMVDDFTIELLVDPHEVVCDEGGDVLLDESGRPIFVE